MKFVESSEIEKRKSKILTRNDKFRKIALQNSDGISIASKLFYIQNDSCDDFTKFQMKKLKKGVMLWKKSSVF